MRSARFIFRLAFAFLNRHRKIILLGFFLGIIFFFLIPTLISLIPKRKETKSIGLVGRYTLETIPSEVQALISAGLTRINDDGTPAPDLAKDWTVNNDGKTYTFHLKDHLFWHDGTPLKAKDINYNFKDASTSVIDDKTIQFTLKESFAPFPTIVARPVFKKGLVGTGPYRVQKISRSGQFVESIYLVSEKKENPDLMYRFYPTESAAKISLKLGEVSLLKNIIEPDGFADWRNIKITPVTRYNQYVALFFDTSKPNVEEKSFRQALAYATPKDQKEERALTPISPHSWAYNSDVKPYDYNPQKAKELLSKIQGGKKDIAMKLSAVSYLLPEAEKIAKAWEDLGLKVTVEGIKSQQSDTQALLAIQEIPPDPDQYPLWHSTQETGNITNFKSPRIDKLLEDGRKTQEKDKRKKIYYDFQRFLVEEVPAVFLYYPVTYDISRT